MSFLKESQLFTFCVLTSSTTIQCRIITKRGKGYLYRRLLFLSAALIIAYPHTCRAEIQEQNIQTLIQLQEIIRQQQKQLQQQTEQIKLQSERIDALQQQVNNLQDNKTNQPAITQESSAKVDSFKPSFQKEPNSLLTINSGNNRIKLSISGQLNRAVNIVNDGGKTKAYHVDNSVSGSRIRFIGTAEIDDDLSIGARIEVGITPDTTSNVSQNNPSPGTYFDQRWTEISLTSVKYGKISLGKGDTASNSTAEVDLSRTDVVQYASISDIASAMLFRPKADSNALTTIKVSDVFQDRDGLSRQSRLRYDTPDYHGFSLAASIVSNQRYDAAIFWNGNGYGLKAAGALAVSEPKLSESGLQYNGSLSILHKNSGLNFTISGGLQKRDTQKSSTNIYGKIGWIADLSKFGNTAFGIDYTRSENLPLSGDSGWSLGAAAVQFIDKISTELYLQYRIYRFNRNSGEPVKDISVSSLGARVKF